MKDNKHIRVIILLFSSVLIPLFTFIFIINIQEIALGGGFMCSLADGKMRGNRMVDVQTSTGYPACQPNETVFGTVSCLNIAGCSCCAPKPNVLFFNILVVLFLIPSIVMGIKYYKKLIRLKTYMFSLTLPMIVLVLILFGTSLYKAFKNHQKHTACYDTCYIEVYGSGKSTDEYEQMYEKDRSDTISTCVNICDPQEK